MSAIGLATAAVDRLDGPRLSILIFHRALREADPLFPEEIDAPRFERLAGLLARQYRVLTLGEALNRRALNRLPRRAVVITFDDGYADNAEVALPILRHHGLRATFFVATGYLDGGRMFNDSVIACVRATAMEQADLSPWGLGVRNLCAAPERRAVIELLLSRVKYCTLDDRERQLERLHRALGSPPLPNGLMMRAEQVAELYRAGMEIGGHTDRHPILRVTSDSEAEAEIVRGRQRLESLIGAPVEVFAYPNGRPGRDYDARHVAMVRRLGFRGAVTTAIGVAHAGSDPFQLPRFTPWDRNPARWAGRLLHSRLTGAQPGVVPAP